MFVYEISKSKQSDVELEKKGIKNEQKKKSSNSMMSMGQLEKSELNHSLAIPCLSTLENSNHKLVHSILTFGTKYDES